MPLYSEQEIIEGCRKSDRTFQEHLYKEYYSMFLKVCARYARDMQDAEQLLNDGFLKIFLNIGSYKSKGSFGGWMRRVIVNTCLDHLRSNYLKDTMIMHVNAMPVSNKTSVNNSGLENIEFKELLSLIQSLPVMTRTVFNLFVFEGFNHKEISKQLDISEKTSHWHVHQAREVLQKKLKKNESQKVMYESKRI